MKTTKSTLTIAREALQAGQESLPDYRRRKSPHKFTQPQLFACLVVQEFRCLDYRGIWVLLQEWPELRNVLGLKKVPHFTTLWAASKRLLAKPKADALLNGVLRRCRKARILGKRTPLAAIDSTGLESRHVSVYYTKRTKTQKGHYKSRYPKLSVVGDTANHLILGGGIDRGPKPDLTEARPTVRETVSHQPLGALLGDAGFEAEGFHVFCRDELNIRSIIPTRDRGRPRADGQPRPVRGRYRRLMKSHFPTVLYGQRWQAETIFSMLKRNYGSALRARRYQSQNREMRLQWLTHDLGILLRSLVT
ncbi:MAG: IS4/IS5 family transposase [Planctomycetaceae bacterium]|nr:MAG: IS4/IS5 family transposase [Planctomycetaceae bacterium]